MLLHEKIYFRGAHIGITGYCNFNCIHCYSNSCPENKVLLEFNEITDMIKDLKRLGILTLYVGGGEPLSHPRLIDIIKYIRRLDILPSISTNGSLLTKNRLQELFDAGLKHNLYVSLDGSGSTINDQVRGKGTYDKIVRGLEALSAFKEIQFAVTMVANKINAGDALKTAFLVKDIGGRFLNLCRVDKDGRAGINEQRLFITKDAFLSEVKSLEMKFKCMGNYFGANYLFALRENDQVELVQNTANMNFAVQRIPFGISIDYEKNVYITPMKVHLGVHDGSRSCIYRLVKKALNDKTINDQFALWQKTTLLEY